MSVDVELLDDVVSGKNLERVDLIKMDVEGHEWHVLLGARKTLERFKPVLVFEFSQRQWKNAGFSPEQVEEFLTDLGYDLFVMREDYIMSIRHGVAEHGDLLALPRDTPFVPQPVLEGRPFHPEEASSIGSAPLYFEPLVCPLL